MDLRGRGCEHIAMDIGHVAGDNQILHVIVEFKLRAAARSAGTSTLTAASGHRKRCFGGDERFGRIAHVDQGQPRRMSGFVDAEDDQIIGCAEASISELQDLGVACNWPTETKPVSSPVLVLTMEMPSSLLAPAT